ARQNWRHHDLLPLSELPSPEGFTIQIFLTIREQHSGIGRSQGTLSLFLIILAGDSKTPVNVCSRSDCPCCCFMTNQLLQYRFIDKEKSWDEAQKYCKKNHTDLATVRSMADMKRLNQDLGNKKAWIGLYREANSKRKWKWSQPEVQFSESQKNWDGGEPNDHKRENCGTVKKHLKWADLSCKEEKPFICYDGENVKP
uniref:C-type lectin domain-containing protein n=1 Tax=Oryzias melastigma TaxID=30732 RepID=A0A3B3CS28_ORYME